MVKWASAAAIAVLAVGVSWAEAPAALPDAAGIKAPPEETGAASTLDGPAPLGPLPWAGTEEASADPYVTWARMEYLAAWVKDGAAPPPLVTTGPPGDGSALLGAPGTQVLLGGQPIDYGTFVAGRFAIGSYFALDRTCGFEVTGLVVEQRTKYQTVASSPTGFPVLGRPFIAAQDDTPLVLYAAFPDRFAGEVATANRTRTWGIEVDLLKNAMPWRPWFWRGRKLGDVRAEVRAGFRYLDLDEKLAIGQSTSLLAGGVANFGGGSVVAPATEVLIDQFDTDNQFCGGQVGGRVQYCRGRCFLDVLGKVAVGGVREVVTINGSSTLLVPGFAPTTLPGGLLATFTNIGTQKRDAFAVVPEIGINLGYQLSPECSVTLGYSFLYWSRVVRPGDQIDTTVNVTQVPIHPDYGPLDGPARPLVPFRETDFWVQGLSLGLELRF